MKPIKFNTREEARAFLKRAGLLKTRRTLVGEERERVLTMLRLLGPGEQSNNQHVWTESWRIGNTEYNLHVGAEIDDLEEVIEEDE